MSTATAAAGGGTPNQKTPNPQIPPFQAGEPREYAWLSRYDPGLVQLIPGLIKIGFSNLQAVGIQRDLHGKLNIPAQIYANRCSSRNNPHGYPRIVPFAIGVLGSCALSKALLLHVSLRLIVSFLPQGDFNQHSVNYGRHRLQQQSSHSLAALKARYEFALLVFARACDNFPSTKKIKEHLLARQFDQNREFESTINDLQKQIANQNMIIQYLAQNMNNPGLAKFVKQMTEM